MTAIPHIQQPKQSRKHQTRKFLREYGLSVHQAANLMAQLIHETKCSNPQMLVTAICQSGKSSQSVSFPRAVEESLASKSHRRIRTLREIKYIANRFIRIFPELKKKKMDSITPADCRRYVEEAFLTPRQRYKARAILSGVFTVAIKRDWCEQNPVKKVDVPILREQQIEALSLKQTSRLLRKAHSQDHRPCLPALGLMLYAGIRPEEVKRLTWNEINLEEGVISLKPRHTKTGGTRHVTILPPLMKLLTRHRESPMKNICPSNWRKRWKELRRQAGWDSPANVWKQDVLRHTYASYHAKHFRNFSQLQWEMGHRSSSLLKTRYLNMDGITRKNAEEFWRGIK